MHSATSSSPSTPSSFVTGPDRVPGPRDLAGLQRDTLTIMARNPAIFIALPVLAFLLFDFINELISTAVGGEDAAGTLQGIRAYHKVGQWIELGVGSLVAATVLQAIVAVGEGRTPGVVDAVKAGGAAWGRALKTTFVSGFIVGLASLLFLVPGFFFATRYMLAVPASVMDGLDGTAARSKSSELVKDRGTFRLFLWGAAALFSWYMLSMVPTVTVSFLLPFVAPDAPAVLEAGVNALLAGAWNIVGAGLVVAAGLLYLELTGRSLQWPAGLELRGSDGRRVVGPTGTGQVGLVAVGGFAGLSALLVIPLVAFGLWFLFDAEGATSFVDNSPVVGQVFESLVGEPELIPSPDDVPSGPADGATGEVGEVGEVGGVIAPATPSVE